MYSVYVQQRIITVLLKNTSVQLSESGSVRYDCTLQTEGVKKLKALDFNSPVQCA